MEHACSMDPTRRWSASIDNSVLKRPSLCAHLRYSPIYLRRNERSRYIATVCHTPMVFFFRHEMCSIIGMPRSPHCSLPFRNLLAESHLDLVYAISLDLFRKLSLTVDLDELVSWGASGLVEAATRYRANKLTPFPKFASPRIRGSIYDGLGKSLPLPRSVFRRLTQAPPRTSRMFASDFCASEYYTKTAQVHWARWLATRQTNPYAVSEQKQYRQRLARSLPFLPIKHRILLVHYYLGSCSMPQIARLFRVTKSQISRTHERLMTLLQWGMEI